MSGKKVLVTGASRGIGQDIARLFNEQGAFVVGTATKKPKNDPRYVSEWLEVDFSEVASLDNFCSVLTEMNGFDVCINNAGINIIKPLDEVVSEDYQKIQKINLEAPYKIARATVPGMRNLGGGKIINIASIWSCISKAHRSLYSTTKAGLIGMTRALAVELASHNILVNAVSPGFTMTDLTKKSLSKDQMNELSQRIPLGRFATVDEIAGVVSFLGSDQNTYLTGQNIVVDGGFTIV
ncbi:MAG: SDR family oxidoreductase [Opitutales bacterium]|jgi:3-oxoacyl-[acyl-carrier protein] reductase|tara:strand:- start:4553 stop:5266 length:714 start_codon:yes stop_codon:yes gene_type:complete